MIRIRRGKVEEILEQSDGVTTVIVLVEGRREKAINYDFLTGPLHKGQDIILNTTAVHLGLGTGGAHFVIFAEGNDLLDPDPRGHIMKLRYTPLQVKCFCDEEEGSPYRQAIMDFHGLCGMPVVILELHSMVAPACAAIKLGSKGKAKVAYLMTDGGALPITYSRTVRDLRAKGLIDTTITAGHAFGGEHEAVNVHSGLAIAKSAAKADVTVVAMGPGIVGTGTKYGFTGVEQGETANAVHAMGGIPLLAPRISFADPRKRHVGVSHHTITILKDITLVRVILCLPILDGPKRQMVFAALQNEGLLDKHQVIEEDGAPALEFLRENGVELSTMGRKVSEDREFFLASAAAGFHAVRILSQRLQQI